MKIKGALKRVGVMALAFSMLIPVVPSQAAKQPKLNKTAVTLKSHKKVTLVVKNAKSKVKWSVSGNWENIESVDTWGKNKSKCTIVTPTISKNETVKVTAKIKKKKLICKLKLVKDKSVTENTTEENTPVLELQEHANYISAPITNEDSVIKDSCVGYGFGFTLNSANGAKLCWQATNLTDKVVNYYTVYFNYINPVGDSAYDEITGELCGSAKYVGPVNPGQNLCVYSIVGYVPTCKYIDITRVDLEFADGTTAQLSYNYRANRFSY